MREATVLGASHSQTRNSLSLRGFLGIFTSVPPAKRRSLSVVVMAVKTLRAGISTVQGKKITDVHLISGAVSSDREYWKTASEAVEGKIYNYFSDKDRVLKVLYKIPNLFGEDAIGVTSIHPRGSIENVNITNIVEREAERALDQHLVSKKAASKFLRE